MTSSLLAHALIGISSVFLLACDSTDKNRTVASIPTSEHQSSQSIIVHGEIGNNLENDLGVLDWNAYPLTINITNKSQTNTTLSKVAPSCNCIPTETLDVTIAPEQTWTYHTKFSTYGMGGITHREIEFTDKSGSVAARVLLKANIEPAKRVADETIHLSRSDAEQKREIAIPLYAGTSPLSDIKIKQTDSSGKRLSFQVASSLDADTTGTVKVTLPDRISERDYYEAHVLSNNFKMGTISIMINP